MIVGADDRLIVAATRPPKTNSELWWTVRKLWGVEIPRVVVCDDHTAPFSVFADAFFARHPVIVVKASRGLAGKTFLMATLSLTETAILGASVSMLGGSLAQSKNGHEYTKAGWEHAGAPRYLLDSDPTQLETSLTNGGSIRVLAASTKSVRGPHPHKLRLDEADEMDKFVFESALGQPMESRGISPQTLISSTHHYPNKTFTYILEDLAPDRGWKVHEWCYRESMAGWRTVADEPVDGWLSAAEVERTRATVPSAMWDIEYELGEPSIEGRAIDGEKVEALFDPDLGRFDGDVGQYIEIEEPDPDGVYVTGVDWAKKQDWTIIATFRTDVRPWRCVAWERLGRMPWPVMVRRYEERLRRFPPEVDDKRRILRTAHDATGVGGVVEDYLEYEQGGWQPEPVTLVGQTRSDIFTDYIAGIENDALRYPMIGFAYDQHRYCTLDDLFRTGHQFHAPDSFVAGAMAWFCRSSTGPVGTAGPATAESPSKFRGRV